MKQPALSICLGLLLSNCAHTRAVPPIEMTLPWQAVSKQIADLVEQHAKRSAFDRVAESSVPPECLHSFSAVEKIAAEHDLKFIEAERAQKRKWFESATATWHYTFECQFSGILFFDQSGRVRHAILFG